MSRIQFHSALAALLLAASVSYGSGVTQAQASSDGALSSPEHTAASTASAKSPASTLSVTIYGSDSAHSGDYQCFFWAVASGGTGSGYSYSWSVVSGSGWGSASGDSWTGGGTSDFTLQVTVTDSGSGQASDTHFVDVVAPSNWAAQCYH